MLTLISAKIIYNIIIFNQNISFAYMNILKLNAFTPTKAVIFKETFKDDHKENDVPQGKGQLTTYSECMTKPLTESTKLLL